MDGFVERIHQYDGKEQAELRVRIKIPGTWFDGLTAAEKLERYEATTSMTANRTGRPGLVMGRTSRTRMGRRMAVMAPNEDVYETSCAGQFLCFERWYAGLILFFCV